MIVIGNPGTQRLDHILFVGATGQHDRLEGALFAGDALQLLDQFDAVHVRHVQIAQHQADLDVFTKPRNGLRAGMAWHATVTAAFEEFAQLFHNQRLIVDHEHFHLRGKLVHALLHAWASQSLINPCQQRLFRTP